MLDTSALIAVLQSEPEAAAFKQRIFADDGPVLGAPTKFELLMVASHRPDGHADVLALLREFGCAVTSWTDLQSELAFDAFARFGKGRHPAALNFGDCMAYAVARSLDAPLLFKGGDFALTDIKAAL